MNNYGLPHNYTARLEPAYFDDVLPDSAAWQGDVYRLAASLARAHGIQWLVDIGCGRGEKLLKCSEGLLTLGFDYGENIKHCERTKTNKWESVDLNTQILEWDYFENSVVICADVIEHIPTPDALIQSLRNACETALFVILSTPDRNRVYKGQPHYGPPGNPYHVREWTNDELKAWLLSEHLPIVWDGWTISNDTRPDQVWTSLMVMSKTQTLDELPARYEPASKWNPVIE